MIDKPFQLPEDGQTIEARRLAPVSNLGLYDITNLTWHPNGIHLTFRGTNGPYETYSVFLVDSSGDYAEQIIPIDRDSGIALSSDGSHLAVIGTEMGGMDYWNSLRILQLNFERGKYEYVLVSLGDFDKGFEPSRTPAFADDGDFVAVLGCIPSCDPLQGSEPKLTIRVIEVAIKKYDEFPIPALGWYTFHSILAFSPISRV